MTLFPKLETRTLLAALIIVALCVLLSFSSFLPLLVLIGQLAAALYLVVGVILSLRSPNELDMPPWQYGARILHAQFFYALVVLLFASAVLYGAQALLRLMGVTEATEWAMIAAFSLALSSPVAMAAFSRFLLGKIAGWDRLKFVLKGARNLVILPLAILASATIVALLLSPLMETAINWTRDDAFQWAGWLGLWSSVAFVLARTDFQVQNTPLAHPDPGSTHTTTPTDAPKILFVGADAGDWHVIMPLVKAGRMPNLRKLMESGCYGYLDTFGRMHSPVIWTTIATCAPVELHGITGFFKHDPEKKEKRALFKSYDRQVPAIWDMFGQMGRSVGVVNWMLTYAPERVNGYMISRMPEPAVYPEEFEELLEEGLSQVDGSESVLDMSEITTDMGGFHLVRSPEEAIRGLQRIGTVAPKFMHAVPTDLTMVYEDATDGIQHTTWQYREPERFDATVWGYDLADVRRYGNAIDEAWEEFDKVLGDLLDEFDQNGIVMMASDHGFMPREAPAVYLDMNALLNDMGYLQFNDDGSVDFSRTIAYWSTREITSSYADLSLNHEKQTGSSEIRSIDLEEKVQQVAADLKRLTINDHEALFDYVTPLSINGTSSIRVGLTYETMRMGTERAIKVGPERRELNSYLKVVPDGSGRHDPFGIFVYSGPGIRAGGVVAAGAIHTILNDLLGHVRGLSQHPMLAVTFHLLERFGLLNPYTTNDVAPTLLYLADCPLPSYSAGAVMSRTLSPELKASRGVKYFTGYRFERGESRAEYSEESEQQIVEHLKALGYID
jgi:predicted AlkP superfamily phosphohydrolase/phosphomutase